ncbi:MAG: CoB--CoM heterodisulfide reductase subunit B [Candidatus Thorarchaeota archaeon]|nr:CoB--CoM heterodisulfide reductase subunit B [Candidatus Thorarchaeota archaeon]
MNYAFFPGCTMSDRLPFVEKSVRMVMPEFDVDLIDLPFTCCPEPNSVRSFSDSTWLAMGARNLAVAEEKNLDILTACAGCFESLAMSKHKLDTNASLKAETNRILSSVGHEYKGEVRVRHIHQFFFDDITTAEISNRVVNPIDLRVVTHPGCHLLRPEKILHVDNAEAPTKLDDLVTALGGEPLEYMDKAMCCGAGIRGINREVSFAVLRDKMDSMMMVEPDAAVVFCPTCFISFEAGQRVVNRTFGMNYNLPVYYYTELLAAAMGLPETESVLAGHRVKPKKPIVKVKDGSDKARVGDIASP